jgi:hypothetical protein
MGEKISHPFSFVGTEMSRVAVGSIPEKITYVFAEEAEVSVGCEWDISWYESDDGPKAVKQKVMPAFPVDSADSKTMTRAIEWATSDGWDYQTNKRKVKKHSIEEVENKPLNNVKVLSLEHRGQGGRAYKALINNYYVDLREDVLMDTLLKAGVDSGGLLKGEYVWAKMGSQMKLVRVGSELHRLIAEFDSKKDIKPVGKGDLEVGGVYRDRKKNKAIFVGYVNTVVYKTDNPIPYYQRQDKADFKYKQTNVKKAMLFYEIRDFDSMDKNLKEMKKKESDYAYKIKKSHTYIEKVDQVKIPDGIVAHLRDKSLKEIKQKILEYTGHRPPEKNYARITASYLENHVEYHSDHLNLYVYGETPVEPFEVKKFLLFS